MRTFLAIEIPPAIQTIIRQAQQALEHRLTAAQQRQAIRWTAPAAVHLTLRFLGETTAEQQRLLQDALPRLVAGHSPFALSVQEIGYFPNVHAPNIVWLGLQPADQTLFQLQGQLEQAAQAVGFAAERKPFRPHLTIGRLRQSITQPQQRAIGQLLAGEPATPLNRPPNSRFMVNSIVHMQSELEPTGARYTPLQIFKLAGT